MKITYSRVLGFDQEGELVSQFLETFPKGKVVANRATCAAKPDFPWHALQGMFPAALRERYRLARNALIAERNAARETARVNAAKIAVHSGRDGRDGLENDFSWHVQLSPGQAAEEIINKEYALKFAALFGEFAGKIS